MAMAFHATSAPVFCILMLGSIQSNPWQSVVNLTKPFSVYFVAGVLEDSDNLPNAFY
jgi:hypothetical protein